MNAIHPTSSKRSHGWLLWVLAVHSAILLGGAMLLAIIGARVAANLAGAAIGTGSAWHVLLGYGWLWWPFLFLCTLVLLAVNALVFHAVRWLDRDPGGDRWLAMFALVMYLAWPLWLAWLLL